MPLPMLHSRRAHYVDALVLLRDALNDTPEAASGSEPALEFDLQYVDTVKVAIYYEPIIDPVDDANNWEIALEASDSETGTFVEICTSGPLPPQGPAEIVISGLNLNKIDPESPWVRVTATKTGSMPDINYSAYLTPTY